MRRLLWSPNELGLARAFVAGELEVDGDIFEVVAALRAAMECCAATAAAVRRRGPRPRRVACSWSAGRSRSRRRRPACTVAGTPSGATPTAISHHYDVGNDFYALVLGPSMTYSCARFVEPDTDLTAAQAAKHELVCRKLGLPERRRRSCCSTSGAAGGRWRSMRRPTTTSRSSGSRSPSRRRRRRASGSPQPGVADRVEIRLQDYRRLGE